MNGRTWRRLDDDKDKRIRNLLLSNGGTELPCHADFERWRIQLEDSTFTSYTSGVIYSTPTSSPTVQRIWSEIDEIVGFQYEPPTRNWLFGLDEAGKGEIFGSIFVAGVAFPKDLFFQLQKILNFADTKSRKRSLQYWQGVYQGIISLDKEKVKVHAVRIPPASVDSENLRKLLDRAYIKVIDKILGELKTVDVRIVVDDYMLEKDMQDKMLELKRMGVETIAEHDADQNYLEVKAASVIAKYLREKEIDEIRNNKEFQIDGLTIGTGSSNNPETLRWLKAWHKSNKSWPWFVRKTFRTIAIIEGRKPSKRKFK